MTAVWAVGMIASLVAVFTPGEGWLSRALRVLAIVVALLVLGGLIQRARAMPPGTLDLARITAGEVGVDRVTDDAPAIYAVLARRAARRGVSWRVMARWYSGGHMDRSRTDGRRWVAHLRPDGWEPRGWPLGASWRLRRGVWLDLVDVCARVLLGEVRAPCRPDHYGSTDPRLPDVHRARRAGWERVDCGDTLDGYWRVPWAPEPEGWESS
ncbi:MAG: hypothetical protein ACOC9O_04310 [Myxococcota bacterium]